MRLREAQSEASRLRQLVRSTRETWYSPVQWEESRVALVAWQARVKRIRADVQSKARLLSSLRTELARSLESAAVLQTERYRLLERCERVEVDVARKDSLASELRVHAQQASQGEESALLRGRELETRAAQHVTEMCDAGGVAGGGSNENR